MANDTVSEGSAVGGPYRFRPLTGADLPLLESWLAEPHVRRWWGTPQRELAMMADLMAADWAEVYMVELADRPIAYLQVYQADAAGPDWPDLPPGTWGIDTFIGPPDAIGQGHGAAYLRAFGDQILSRPGVLRLSADPAPDNHASVRAFEKAGFVGQGIAETLDGPARLMIRERPKD